MTGWSRDTSADPEGWTEDNPAWGQCAVTALAIQYTFGGELLRTTVGGVSHYLNRLPGGYIVDLTIGQFGPNAVYDTEPVERTRDYVLSFPDTARRFLELMKR